MRLSKNWLNEWIDLSAKSAEDICAALNEIGLEVDSCERIRVPSKVVVAKVLECREHENSDHLHVCKVDAGEILQIVCGAPNVAEGHMVACALEGAKIGELSIKKAKLRGVESCGMLCSAKELGLGELGNGIMILDESIGELEIGKELSSYPAFDDYLIEIELTPNRGDCLSVRGVARDLAAKFDLPIKDISPLKKSEDELLGIGRLISLHSEEEKNCALYYKVVNLGENFSLNLKKRLRLALIESKHKSAIEGALEYSTHSTGALFRAYDARKINPNENEKISLKIKNGEYKQSQIYAEDKLLGVAGICANKEFLADENTKIAIIEASYTAPEIIANATGEDKNMPKDEMVYRSSRGSEPAISSSMNLLFGSCFENCEWYGGSQQISMSVERANILVNCSAISKMIGMDIEKKEIHKILSRLNFEIASGTNDEQFYAKAPAYRHDIQNIADVCEEIVRIYGIDNIPAKPLNFCEANRNSQASLKHALARNLRQRAVDAGYFECVHYIFDDPSELEAMGFKPCQAQILNPITNELKELRPTLLNSLLNSALNNAKRGAKQIKLFEYGEVFDISGKQSSKLGFVSCGLSNLPSLKNGAKGAELSLFELANDIQKILGKISLKASENLEFLSPYEQAKIIQNGKVIGFLGRVKPSLKKDLPKCYAAQIDFDALKCEHILAEPYSSFPATSRDLSVLVSSELKYEQIKECIEALKVENLQSFYPTDLYSDKSLGDKKSLTISFSFQSNEKTLTDDEINTLMQRILDALKESLGVELR
ncbi:phenylalanine--tRNA ligase subunit beta [Campylobacter sp.]|uniref:phenylalanine--tRNA ligase subunit beta n=1 Tax=Campylobacter sp. TaxID=205 RepID=UPI002A74ACEE|nr:phenylalanine--tRNA ligase subunit beta [Campylobacter sp.]MDY2763892.1 phenylalanine--tRNA ligase subunit beta [Campylobacter sp.]